MFLQGIYLQESKDIFLPPEGNLHKPLYVLVMSRTRFRVNPHSIVA